MSGIPAILRLGTSGLFVFWSLSAQAGTTFQYLGGTGTTLAGPHAVTQMNNGSQVTHFTYDLNGDLTDAFGGKTLCQDYLVIQKPKRASQEARTVSGCTGNSAMEFIYTATGERIAVKQPGKLDVFVEPYLRLTNNVLRVSYGRDVETAEDGTGPRYLIQDHLGSPIAVASATTVEQRIDRYPYGKKFYDTLTHAPQTDHGFTGQLEQQHLHDYNARHYDPELGRFLQADSIVPKQDALGFNRYTYVRNNPVNAVDPTGHASWNLNGWTESKAKFDAISALAVDTLGPLFDKVSNFTQIPGAKKFREMVMDASVGQSPVAAAGLILFASTLPQTGIEAGLTIADFMGVDGVPLPDKAFMLNVGKRVGQGSFGNVYKFKTNAGEVALKVAKPWGPYHVGLDKANWVLNNEVVALKRLGKYVPVAERQILGETESGALVTVSRWVNGKQLSAFDLGRSQNLDLAQQYSYFQIKAEQLRIGDFRPANVIVERVNGRRELVVVDCNDYETLLTIFGSGQSTSAP